MTTIDALESLAEGFSGVILAPGDAGYDAARKIHNGLIDKRPALIACCRNTADIVDAVNAAREADLEISRTAPKTNRPATNDSRGSNSKTEKFRI